MAQGGLSRLAIERLKSAGVPLGPILKRSGLTPELIAEPDERLSVRSQIALLNEAASALGTIILASRWPAITIRVRLAFFIT